MPIAKGLLALLMGTPWGTVLPPRPTPPARAEDGRTTALRILRDYVCDLTCFRRMEPGRPAQPFQILPANFHIEWPDDVQDLSFPSVAVIPANVDYSVIGLTSYVEEESRDVYGPGTVLQWQVEYVEMIELEVWASTKSERRGILAALETAFMPVEQQSGVRFRMPDYFNELVCFTLEGRQVLDDPMSAKGRRRARLRLEMRFNVVALVNYVEFSPRVTVNTDVDQSNGQPVNLDDPTVDFSAQNPPDR